MKSIFNSSPVNKYKQALTKMKKDAVKTGALDEFLELIPMFLSHILLNCEMGIFTYDEAYDLGDFIITLKEESNH